MNRRQGAQGEIGKLLLKVLWRDHVSAEPLSPSAGVMLSVRGRRSETWMASLSLSLMPGVAR